MADPVAPGVPVPPIGSTTWTPKDKKTEKKMIAARDSLRVGSIRKQDAHKVVLETMAALKKVRLKGSQKREVVVDAFLHGAESDFRSMFPSEEQFRSFVCKMVNDAYAALGSTVFGGGGCCRR